MKHREDFYLNELINISKKGKTLQEQGNDMDLRMKIIDFLKKNPNPPDEKVHEFADSLGIEHDKLESEIYAILTTMLKTGKHQDTPDSEFDPEQLKMGIEVEKEHTDCPYLAKEIAKDHLAEIPDYYSRLKKMEEEGGVKE